MVPVVRVPIDVAVVDGQNAAHGTVISIAPALDVHRSARVYDQEFHLMDQYEGMRKIYGYRSMNF